MQDGRKMLPFAIKFIAACELLAGNSVRFGTFYE